jgi:hypothetical protein
MSAKVARVPPRQMAQMAWVEPYFWPQPTYYGGSPIVTSPDAHVQPPAKPSELERILFILGVLVGAAIGVAISPAIKGARSLACKVRARRAAQ